VIEVLLPLAVSLVVTLAAEVILDESYLDAPNNPAFDLELEEGPGC
jgi:hypothetical protein